MSSERRMENRTTLTLAVFSTALVLTSVAQGLTGFGPATVQAADMVVTPGSLGDWNFQTSGTASGRLVTGPGTPPLGNGSLRLGTGTNGSSGVQFRNNDYANTRLDDITELGYYTYVTNNQSCQAPYIVLNIDRDSNGSIDDTLFFEPCYQTGTYSGSAVPNQGSVADNTWQQWNALTGGWWANDAGRGGPPLITLADYIDDYPNARIVNSSSGAGGIRLVAGFGSSSWNNFVGYADAFSIGVDGSTTRYDFEPMTSSSSSRSSTSMSSFSSQSSTSTVACTTVGTSDLLAHWPFNAGNGSTAEDASNDHDGTLVNMEAGDWITLTPSIGTSNPYAIDFDGTTGGNEYVSLGTNQIIGADTSFTIAGWVNMDTFTSAQNPIYGEFNTNGHTRNYLGVGSDRRVFFDQYTPSGGGLFSNTLLNAGQWYHVAYVQSGSTRSLYINGNLDVTDNTAENYSGSTPNFVAIGARPGPSPFYMNGKVDEMRLYGRTLAASEVRSLSNYCGPSSSRSSSSASSMSASSMSSQSSRSSSSGGFATAPLCNGVTATIYVNQNNRIVGGPDNGTRFTGVLRGTRGNDIMVGTNGRDLILGGTGNDTICGGGGSDRLYGGLGEDKIGGESGSDRLDGSNGKDLLCGHDQNDDLRGGNANDTLDGGAGNDDELDGGNGTDVCSNGEDTDDCETTSSGSALCSALRITTP